MCFLPSKKHQTQSSGSVLTAGTLVGQGATEYLVLLAVVLIVALVSVALLGFFPGMASDAQATQSKMYWQSASPIAITEWSAAASGASGSWTDPYLRIKNSGVYSIRITKLLSSTGEISQFYCNASVCGTTGRQNISSYYYLTAGEENYFSSVKTIEFYSTTSTWTYVIGNVSSKCSSTPPYGTLIVKNFGFEYIEYIDGQQITKRQIGKDLIIKCSQPPA